MMRIVFLGLCALIAAAPVRAADAPAIIGVVFSARDDDWRDRRLVEAIREALSRTPSFNLMSVVTPDALVISVPGGFGRDGYDQDISYNFTAAFFRNGDKIGESLETCKANALEDCAGQLAADAQSAAGVMK